MIEESGNYTAGGNSFQYGNPNSIVNVYNATVEYIKFTSQLSHKVDVFLVVKTENPGVQFSYVLPPIKNSQQSLTNAKEVRASEEPKPAAVERTTERVKLQEYDSRKQ